MASELKTKRASGFYVTLLAALLCLASAILYSQYFRGVIYTHGPLFSDLAFILLIAGAVLSILLLFVKLEGFAPVVLALASGAALLMFIYHMVWPIADIFTAIDPVSFIPQLRTCAILLGSSFVFSEIAIYMKKRKAVA